MKFWKKKGKKSKSTDDKEAKSTESDEIKAQPETEDSSNSSISALEDAKTDKVNESDGTVTLQEKTKGDISVETESKEDDSTEATISETVDTVEETEPIETGASAETQKTVQEEYDDYESSGVFIFSTKIAGRFQKVFLATLAIIFIPPTFLFSIALLLCVFLLLFPLVAIIIIAVFPATVFSFFIIMAAMPVLFPAILIFILITGNGKLSAFAEGKLLVLKLYRWTLPTI